ncbi:MAG: hypothetical protein V2A71_00900 [Candidatus Eisenbacteria bacterium]
MKPAWLWGRQFNIVEEGLSPSQVISFVAELIDQQRALAERVRHLTVANDRLLFYFKNLVAETRILEEEMGQADILKVREPSAFSVTVLEAGNNGHKGHPGAETDCGFPPDLAGTGEDETLEKTGESAEPAASVDSSPLFEGEIEIIVAPPVDMAKLVRLRRNLQNVVHLKVLRTDGCWTGANVFTAFIDRPLPLISLLTAMPDVKKAGSWTDREKRADDGFPWGLALEEKLGNWIAQKIIVWLKSVEGEEK